MYVCVRTHALLYSCSVRPIPFDSFSINHFLFESFKNLFFSILPIEAINELCSKGKSDSRCCSLTLLHCKYPEARAETLFVLFLFFSLFILCYCCLWSKQSSLRFLVNYWVLYYMIIYKIFNKSPFIWIRIFMANVKNNISFSDNSSFLQLCQ